MRSESAKSNGSAGLTFVFVDETGIGESGRSLKCLCSICMIGLPWDAVGSLNARVERLRGEFLEPGRREFAAHRLAHDLRDREAVEALAQRLSDTITSAGANVWVAVTRTGIEPPQNLIQFRGKPRELARQLAWERITGYLRIGHHKPRSWLIVWDLPESEELAGYSRALSAFTNPFLSEPLHPAMEPRVLGGRSEHWGALQVADLIANFAVHYAGSYLNLQRVERRRVRAFENHFDKCLVRDSKMKEVGLALWIGPLPEPDWG
jgi:hypothetical protein